ncbi:ArsR family transcriptional regulator [Rhodothalassium salexigens DSM 2132]|nr:ArsR family transcriptional regulator [Rhodothalassium salexigens DSM 2132]
MTELTHILRQSQPRVSRHLRLLCDADLLDRFREGAWVFYRLSDRDDAQALVTTIAELIPEEDPEFSRDLERLAEVRARRAAEAADYFSRHAPEWDRMRSLYVPEEQVEATLLSLAKQQRPQRLLDIGTGTGRILEVFSPHIRRGLGIDLSAEMLTVARNNLAQKRLGHCQVRLGDMYDIPADRASQDTVVLHQVLHFADDPSLAIREAARVLRPGGTCLIVDFAPHEKEFLREEHAHRRLGFSDEEINGLGEAAGLAPTAVEHLDGGELTVTIWRLDQPGVDNKTLLEAAE